MLNLYRSKKVTNVQVIVGTEWNLMTTSQCTPPLDNQLRTFRNDEQTSGQPRNQLRRSVSQPPPQRETATQRIRRQQDTDYLLATTTNSSVLDLTTRYQCKDRTCLNHGHTCFPTKQLGHLAVTSLDLTVWNEAIRANRASLNNPPTDMITGIVVRRFKAKGKSLQVSLTRATSTAGNTYIISGGGGPVSALPGLGWGGHNSHRSSPLTFKGSEVDNLKEYLGWLVRKGYLTVELGDRAQSAMLSDGWGFQ